MAIAGDVGPLQILSPGDDNLGSVPIGPWFLSLQDADVRDGTATLILGRALGAPCASMESVPNVPNLSAGGPWFVQRWLAALAFFGLGAYSGFIQAGVGFMFLALLSSQGLDLVRGNAVKIPLILCFTGLAMVLFALRGMLDWQAAHWGKGIRDVQYFLIDSLPADVLAGLGLRQGRTERDHGHGEIDRPLLQIIALRHPPEELFNNSVFKRVKTDNHDSSA